MDAQDYQEYYQYTGPGKYDGSAGYYQGYDYGESHAWGAPVASAELGYSGVSTSYGAHYETNVTSHYETTVAASSAVSTASATAVKSSVFDPHTGLLAEPGPIYPRVITALQLLEESDDNDSVYCGPSSEPGEEGLSELRALEFLGISFHDSDRRRGEGGRRSGHRGGGGGGDDGDEPAPRRSRKGESGRSSRAERGEGGESSGRSRGADLLIQPRGEHMLENVKDQKFVCVFQIGLEDDEEFCLVKRILGKAGNNMRRIAEECNAKVRLRGIGSGFLEGANGREANMPLQLNVSCTDFDSYKGAVDRVSGLLNELYKHYRRYVRSKGMEPPEVKLNLEEVRRDDLNMDLLSQKAQRSASQRERDRREREKDRQVKKEEERERQKKAAEKMGIEFVEKEPPKGPRPRQRSRERDRDLDDDEDRPRWLLPDGQPVPTTPAGRRAAARAGGAAAAAVVSAAAREAERQERDRLREERDRERAKEREERDRKKLHQDEKRNKRESRGSRYSQSSKAKAPPPPPPVAAGAYNSTGGAVGKASPPEAKGKGKGKAAPDAAGAAGPFKAKAPPPPPPGPPPEDAVQVHMAMSSKGSGKASAGKGKKGKEGKGDAAF